jgi:predicted aspartyl protease
MSRYRYNQQIVPPAPFVYVTIEQPVAGGLSLESPAQLDTAADASVIPLRLAEALGLEQLGELPAIGVDGRPATLATFLVRIGIRDYPARTAEVFASQHEPYVLLGRDLLNRFRIVLDGPNLLLDIE